MKEGSALGHQLCFDPYYSQPILIQLFIPKLHPNGRNFFICVEINSLNLAVITNLE